MKSIRTKRAYIIVFIIFMCLGTHVFASDWYVDNTASGKNNGTSWQNGWESLNDIKWSSISAGDTIYISGGNTSKTYYERLAIGKSGSPGNPIVIRVGQDYGHNGVVVITRNGSSFYESVGILISSESYITIDGSYNNDARIRVTNCSADGVYISGTSNHIILTNMEVDNNGTSNNQNGIHIQVNAYAYPIVEVSNCKIHDNYQDQIFVNGPISVAKQYDSILVHHNDIYNLSDDGIECTAAGLSFYNNFVHTRADSGGEGHSDGLQALQGYVKVYNNVFYDLIHPTRMTNSAIFIDWFVESAAGHTRVYNNLIFDDPDKYVFSTNYYRGIEVYLDNDGPGDSVTDVVIANNTICNMPFMGLTIYMKSRGPDKVNDVRIENNIIYNCQTLAPGSACTVIGSGTYVAGSEGDGADLTWDYNAIYGGNSGSSRIGYKGTIYNYDTFVLQSGCQKSGFYGDPTLDSKYYPVGPSSLVVDNGYDLSEFFNRDINGYARPQGDFWDAGTYEYSIDNKGIDLTSPSSIAPNPPKGLRIK